MKRLAAPTLVLGLVVLAAPALAEKNPACIRWRAQPVATGAGYNHVVTIENGCDEPAACVISTDVAPDPIQATVPAKQKVELTTFRGSPASTFKPRVECTVQ